MDATQPIKPDPMSSTDPQTPTANVDRAPLECILWLKREVDPATFLQTLSETLKTGYEIKKALLMPGYFLGMFDERSITFLLACPEVAGICKVRFVFLSICSI